MGEFKFIFKKGKVLFKEGYCDGEILTREKGQFDYIVEDEEEYENLLEDGEIDPETKVVYVSDCEKIVRESFEKDKFKAYKE